MVKLVVDGAHASPVDVSLCTTTNSRIRASAVLAAGLARDPDVVAAASERLFNTTLTATLYKQFTMRPTQALLSGGGPSVGKYGW